MSVLHMQTVRDLYHIGRWTIGGKPAPPPHAVKQRTIRRYQKQFGPQVFVETGTYLGEMVAAMTDSFREVYSIELSHELFGRARKLFAAQEHIHIMEGDSSTVLPAILAQVNERCLFWLDGHFSGGVTAQGSVDYPILQELAAIGTHSVKDHVILIDDARLFVGSANAPAKEQLVNSLRAINPTYKIEERDDIIRAFVAQN